LISRGTPSRSTARASRSSQSSAAALSNSLATLLRTRAPYEPQDLHALGLDQSLLGYGLPDLSMHDPETPRGRAAIGQAVAAAIRRCEPRCAEVTLVEVRPAAGLGVTIEIRATLRESRDGPPVAIRAQLDRGRNLSALRCEPAR
jgi:predicted component of type VI protein secretion system